MKRFLIIVSAVIGGNVNRRGVDTIDCPGRCWDIANGVCVPQAGKIEVDCSKIGHVSASLDPCLFTPDNADYTQEYKVFTLENNVKKDTATCFQKIENEDDTLKWSWTYSEAADCGWEWSKSGSHLVFGSVLQPSDNVNKRTIQGQVLTVSAFPDDIEIECKFNNHMSLSADYSGVVSTATQTATTSENDVSLADGFSVEQVDASDNKKNKFTVGEALTTKFSFDHTEAGYEINEMPFGFFASKCVVENKANALHKVYVIGSSDDSISDQCNMKDANLNLHVSNSLEDAPYWSSESYGLTFDAFKFGSNTEMSITCEFELCLKADCGSVADQSDCGNTPAEWSQWGNFGTCSATCSGFKTRTRTCPSGSCTGESSDKTHCNTFTACPPAAEWSQWGNFGTCSATCGTGKQTRTRTCSSEHTYMCTGDSSDTTSCNTVLCPPAAPKCAPDDWEDSQGYSCSAYAAHQFCTFSGEIGENTPFGGTFLPEFNGYVATDCKPCGCTDD